MVRASRSSRRWRLIAVFVSVIALGAAAGCTGTTQWRSPDGASTDGPASAPGASQLVLSPAADAKDVSPVDPVTAELTGGGTLETVSLTNPDGRVVQGEFDASKTSWKNTEELGYNRKYKLQVVGTGADGQRHEESRSFTTVKPNNYTLPYLRANVATLLDGGTFGVGQPIVVWFDEPIKDKKTAEQSLLVTTEPVVEGAWRWMDNREVHWRPKVYWPAGTKVTVEAKVYGKNLGDGLFGQEDRKASFTIGPSKIAVADSKTHRMKVWIDGKLITKINGVDTTLGIPISMGKGGQETGANGQVIDFTTHSGPHVVTTKHEVYRMTSASFGITDKDSPNYYDEKIKKSIRISGSGEFVHLADWNIWAHGKVNTSHGCINVAPTYIYWFYDTFGAGDIVDVRNTGLMLPVRDGLGDWVMPWDQWVKGSALAS
ncbi:MAG TPA: Ig-like domain-containing protein [Micromonosporaceae bacterium]